MSSEKIVKTQIKITRADPERPLERTGHIYEVRNIEVEIKLVDDSDDENDDENEIVIESEVDADDDDVDGEITASQVSHLIAELYEYLENFTAPDNTELPKIIVSRSATPDEVSRAIEKQIAIQTDAVDGDLSWVIRELDYLAKIARETYRRVYTQAAE